jgi:single-stranded DNA-binding protein
MAYEDNKVQITGNLGFDVETRFFDSGEISEMKVALYMGKNKPPNWVKVKKWGAIDPSIKSGLVKGARITARGYLSPCEAWISRTDNQAKGTTVITAEEIEITPWEDRSGYVPQGEPSPHQQAKPNALESVNKSSESSIEDYDDIPF